MDRTASSPHQTELERGVADRRPEHDDVTFRNCHITNEEDQMRQITLGRSGLSVSRIAFGTWQLGGDWGPTDAETAVAAIRRAADHGVTFFDTAQSYGFGASERLLGEALRGRPRDELVIATKGGLRQSGSGVVRDASARQIITGVDDSLRALETDYIDLYQIHWPDPATPFEETAEAIAKLMADGKVRHVGVSNFDAAQIETFSATVPVETVQPPYHLFRRGIEHELLPFATAHDLGVLVYGPLAHGLLGGRLQVGTRFAAGDWRSKSPVFNGQDFERNLEVVAELDALARGELHLTLGQLAIAWVLANPAVHVSIVGTRDPRHVDEAIGAADVELDTATMQRIAEIMRRAVSVAGPSPEMM
jgi:aryl-alcohol dehydrogenase-like predicted oxidoreductase